MAGRGLCWAAGDLSAENTSINTERPLSQGTLRCREAIYRSALYLLFAIM